MHPRIKELAKQAEYEYGSHGAFGEYESRSGFDIEEFARLIIEDCAKIAWNYEPDFNGPIETAIRQHFGIK
jgi:hypothetical protein